MRGPIPSLLVVASLMLIAASPSRGGKFDEGEAKPLLPSWLKLTGLADLRFYSADREVAWLRGGPNRLRYGGRDNDADGRGETRVQGVSIPQASLVVEAELHPGVKAHVQTTFTTDSSSGNPNVGVIESYVDADHSFGDDSLRLRAGAFIPPLSWEHPGVAWSTRYTLTPSAIGAWVGEEVKAFGAELVWERPLPQKARLRLTGGGFGGGDQIGRLLWYRGWALHDYVADLGADYALRGGRDRPFKEQDGRLGYYGRGDLHLFDRALQMGGGYWTNNSHLANAATAAPAYDSEPFKTELFHYGGKLEWKRWALISQFMRVTVSSAGKPPRDWNAAFLLGSAQAKKVRLSARYDRYGSLNWDNGFAWTAFVGYDLTLRQQLAVEYVYASARPGQGVRPKAEIDRLAQVNYRLRF